MSTKDPDRFPDFIAEMDDKSRHQWVKAIVRRLMQAWDVKEQKALSLKLGLHINTVSNWIQNRSVPWSAIYNCHKHTGRTLDWLITGESPQLPGQIDQRQIADRFAAGVDELLTVASTMEMVTDSDALFKGIMAAFNKAWEDQSQDAEAP